MALAVWELDGPGEGGAAAGPVLRLLPELEQEGLAPGSCRRTDRPLAGSGRARRSLLERRLRTLAAVLVLVLVVLLALPVRIFAAGSPRTALLRPSSPGHPSVYVVQAGDTLWSIATRLDPTGDPRPLVAQLSAETGSVTVVPGEHLVLPD